MTKTRGFSAGNVEDLAVEINKFLAGDAAFCNIIDVKYSSAMITTDACPPIKRDYSALVIYQTK